MPQRILTEIWIYPVKSLGGIRVPTASVCEKGLQFDRRWMLVDEEGEFLTRRDFPHMAHFKMAFAKDGFTIRHYEDEIFLPVACDGDGPALRAKIWDDEVTVIDQGAKYQRWFSERMGLPCHLVRFPENNPRPVDPNYRLASENVSLADGFPLLIIGMASLRDVNSRMTSPVPMNRFRPNLVFEGGAAFEEDDWKEFKVGENRFAGVKPCARCVMTTVDNETGAKGREPLVALSRYRKKGENIFFGQNVIAIDYKEIHEGDEIFVG